MRKGCGRPGGTRTSASGIEGLSTETSSLVHDKHLRHNELFESASALAIRAVLMGPCTLYHNLYHNLYLTRRVGIGRTARKAAGGN